MFEEPDALLILYQVTVILQCIQMQVYEQIKKTGSVLWNLDDKYIPEDPMQSRYKSEATDMAHSACISRCHDR